MKKLFLLTVVIAIAFAAQTASAGPIAIANSGFESHSGGDPTWQNPVDTWSFASNEAGHAASRGETGGPYPSSVPEGNMYLNIYKNTWIWQMTAADLKTTGVYDLSYEVSDGNSATNTWVSVAIYAGEQWGAGTNQVEAMFYLKATDTDAVLNDKEFHTYSFSWDTEDAANTAFVAANAGDSIWVRITAGPYTANPAAWFYFDDIQLSWTPEPATIALLGLGGLLLRRKRR